VPPLLLGLVDDAAVFPPGSLSVAEAQVAHREHRMAWYSPLIGPLLLPVDALDGLTDREITLGLIGEAQALDATLRTGGLDVRQVECAVAKRGEDPLPGVARLVSLAADHPTVEVYAEIPLAWGLLSALDALTEAPARVTAKFRTGGLAAELFPTPMELAAVICACRDRNLPFKLTAGLHRAVRYNDPETGFTHHGFVNVLAACIAASTGAEVMTAAELLASTDGITLVEAVRPYLSIDRPLWTGFGSCNVDEPMRDLSLLGLLTAPEPAA
jgi:hypothetical protein